MTETARHLARGRGLAFGLALLMPASCDGLGADDRPAAVPNPEYEAPSISETEGVRLLEVRAPRERLILHDELPSGALTPLFLAGRAATPLPDGGSAWPDTEGARIVLFDRGGMVSGVLQGAAADGRVLAGPVSVAADERGVLAAEPDGSALLFRDGRPEGWLSPGLPGPLGGSSRAGSAAARSYLEFALAPVRREDPLLWIVPAAGGEPQPVGRAKVPANALLGQLVNAGWAAVGAGGESYFASALEPEFRRFGRDGELEWISRWPVPKPVPPPRFTAEAGQVSPKFTVVQHGLVLGPDGRAYVLATPEPDSEARWLLAFGRSGELVRSGEVPADGALFADRAGRVFSVPLSDALSRTGAPARASFPTFDLPALDNGAKIDLESYRGRIVVLNFWASWCAPCRREMPLLSAFAAELDPERAAVVGLNEDLRPSDGLRFVEELGGVSYLNAAGKGRLRDQYGYRGLPYTVVLDRELKVVRSFYGFGRTIQPIRETVMSALGSSATDAGAGSDVTRVTENGDEGSWGRDEGS